LADRDIDVKGHPLLYALSDKTRPSPWVAETDIPILTDPKYPNALLLDGSRAMTGDLLPDITKTCSVGSTTKQLKNLATQNLYIDNDFLFKFYSANWLKLRNWADTAYRNIILGSLACQGDMLASNYSFGTGDFTISTYWAQGNKFTLCSYYGGAYQSVARAINDYFDIMRAGDITLLSNKLLNAVAGALRLPNTRPSTPQAGDTRYDPTTDTFEIYDGAVWRPH